MNSKKSDRRFDGKKRFFDFRCRFLKNNSAQVLRLALGILGFAAMFSLAHLAFRARAIAPPQTAKQNAQRSEGLENYDIRRDENARALRENFRAQAGRGEFQAQNERERFAAAENNLRQRVPSIRVEYGETLGAPATIAPDARLFGKTFLTGASDLKRAEILRRFVLKNNELLGLTGEQTSELKTIADYQNPDGNLGYALLEQTINGIPVFQAKIKAGFTKRGEMFRVVNNLAPALDYYSVSGNFGDAQAAVQAAFKFVSRPMKSEDSEFNGAESTDLKAKFGAGDWATTAEKFYFPLEAGVARAAWRVLVWEPVNAYYVVVDAETGALLWRENIVAHQSQPATFNVYSNTTSMLKTLDSPAPMSPGLINPIPATQAPLVSRTNVTLVGNEAPNAFNNLGWITDGNNTTDGNNVEAGVDRSDPNGVDATVAGTNRVFSFNYTPGNPAGGEDPLLPEYQKGAVTQLFYIANRYHDELYKLGFTEAAGNFQNDNFGRGGEGGDRISAEAQDSSGVNNANFETPADGNRPRMQIYLFNYTNPRRDSDLDAQIVAHELTHGLSFRLIEGFATEMSAGLGEGWSDFYALCLLSEPTDQINATYPFGAYSAGNYYYGLRRFPTAIISFTGGANNRPHNPLTFADIDSNQVNINDGAFAPNGQPNTSDTHFRGEVWNSALWEVRAKFIQRLGATEGNRRILQFVTDGMKLTPFDPTFLEARDAILAAAIAGGTEADYLDVWSGFAVRGMGFSAQVTDKNNVRVVESFDVPQAVVINTNDSGAGSLRAAVANAPAGATITFDTTFFSVPRTITLTSGGLVINKNLTVQGVGADLLTVSGNNQYRVFEISPNVTAQIKGITVTGGNINNIGAGIYNRGTTAIEDCHITGNSASYSGGGISNYGVLTVRRSAITNNTSNGANTTGGIENWGSSLTIENTTISGNRSTNTGGGNAGGLLALGSGSVTVSSSTVTDNQAAGANSAGGIYKFGGTINVQSSIVAGNCTRTTAALCGNATTPDVAGAFTSNGYNLIGNRGSAAGFTQTGDQTGTGAAPLDPLLDMTLALNGGKIPSHAFLFGSPALDKGKSFGLTVDQRGFARPIDFSSIPNAAGGDGADIGAFEAALLPPVSLTVTSDADATVGAAGCSDGCSLREAISEIESNSFGNQINFNPAFFNVPRTITLLSGQILINKNVSINAPGANLLTISGNNQSRIFQIPGGRTVNLSGMTLTNGNIADNGGGIYNDGYLTLNACHLKQNKADYGSAVYNDGTLVLTGSTVSGNTAVGSLGSGSIDGVGAATVTNSTFSGNSTPNGDNNAGAIWANGNVTVISSTIANNSVAGANSAGGIYGAATVRNSIIAANSGNNALPDVSGSFNSEGYNLIGNVGTATGFNKTGDQTGTAANVLNPRLAPLAMNGGTTLTHALLSGSPAINSGTATNAPASDQRGAPRDGAVDIGAFELQSIYVTGKVVYGTTPEGQNAKFVSGVSLAVASGGSNVFAVPITDSAGNYLFDNLNHSGNYIVTPTKSGGVNGITAFDATLVLRCVAAGSNCALTDNQKLAADANKSGNLTAFDATQILRFVAAAGATTNTGAVGIWKFTPGARNYAALNSSLTTENYTAILVGEINGNWSPPSQQ